MSFVEVRLFVGRGTCKDTTISKVNKYHLSTMRSKTDNAMREALGDFLGILEYKARNGVMSVEDVRSILAAIEASGGIKATVKEIAGYYHQSEDNVRHVIHRNLMPNPKRMVYYDFGAFRENVPPRWTNKCSLPAD